MITGDSPLATFHVAEVAELADRDALILELKEDPRHEAGKLVYCDVIMHPLILSL